MINSTYLYLIFSSITIFCLLILFFNLKTNKSNINNKILLKNLLEGFELDLPEELKTLDNSSTDPQKLS
tara:strand:+ start:110 stop:316 length:207 start_codon:yes stop_codon:yes gene_type:complete